MKKDKLYLIISILFVAVILIITIEFRKTYAAAPTGDLGGEGDLYWAIDGDDCLTANAGCTFKMSNNPIDGTHYVNGKFDGTKSYTSSSIPWKDYTYYINGINNVVIGGEGDIIKPTSTAYWFFNFQAPSVDLTYLDTSDVTNMSDMFVGFGTNDEDVVIDLRGLNTSKVKDMSNMFDSTAYRAKSLTILGLDTLDLSSVENMTDMFAEAASYCENVSLNFNNSSTTSLKDISGMFSAFGYESKSVSIDVTNFNTSKVEDMSAVFGSLGENASSVEVIGLDTWDTSNVTDISRMFDDFGINSITIDLDLSGWDLSKVTKMSSLFSWTGRDSKNLTIDMSNWKIPVNFANDYIYYEIGLNAENVELIMKNWDLSNKNDLSYFFSNLFTGSFDEEKEEFEANYTLDVTGWNTSNVEDMSYMFYNTTYYSYETFSSIYRYYNKLNVIGIDTWDTSNVTNMSHMFSDCNIVGLDLSNFNTSKVEDMSYMFANFQRPSLDSLPKGINNFDTSNVTNMTKMFANSYFDNSKEVKLDLSGWNTSNVIEYDDMFYESIVYYYDGVAGFSEIKVGNKWTLPLNENNWLNNETKIVYTYGEIPQNVTGTYVKSNIYWKIEDDTLILSSKYLEEGNRYKKGNKSSNSAPWNAPCSYAAGYFNKVKIGGTNDIIYPTDMYYWFSENNDIEEIDLTYLDTRNVADMSYAFATGVCGEYDYESDSNFCHSSLKKIKGIENLDTSNVENMEGLFAYNYSLEELDLSKWDTSKVTNMSAMFLSDAKLKKITGIENLNVSNVKKFNGMFELCSNIEKLDLNSWDTSKAVNMSAMFMSSKKLKEIEGIENLNVSNVEDFTNMFGYCSSIEKLDLSNWNTKNGTCDEDYFDDDDDGPSVSVLSSRPNMSINQKVKNERSVCEIFYKNTSLNEIKVGENFNIQLPYSIWKDKNTNEVYLSEEIPVGVASTYINEGLVYWTIDNGTLILSSEYNKDYNSLDTNEYILNQNNWLDYSESIEEILIDDEIKPIIMNEWFKGLTKVKKLDLSNVDTSNLQSVYKLVNDMDNLEELNLTNLDLSNIKQCKYIYLNSDEYDKDILYRINSSSMYSCPHSSNPNINKKVESSHSSECDHYFINCIFGNETYCDSFYNNCSDYILSEYDCSETLFECEENGEDLACEMFNNQCKTFEYNESTCSNILYYYYDAIYFGDIEKEFGNIPLYDNNCSNIKLDDVICSDSLYYCQENDDDLDCKLYENYCSSFEYNKNSCENILYNYYYDDERGIGDFPLYDDNCKSIGNTGSTCLENKFKYDRYRDDYAKEFLDAYCQNFEVTSEALNKYFDSCLSDDYYHYCEVFDFYGDYFEYSESDNEKLNTRINEILRDDSDYGHEFDLIHANFKLTDENNELLNEKIDDCLENNNCPYYLDVIERIDFKYTDNNVENINQVLDKCLYEDEYYYYCDLFDMFDNVISVSDSKCDDLAKHIDYDTSWSVLSIYNNKCSNTTLNIYSCENVLNSCWNDSDDACEIYENKCKEIGNTGVRCMYVDYYNEEDGYYEEFLDKYCPNITPTVENCNYFNNECEDDYYSECTIFQKYCKSLNLSCDLFNNNDKLKQISVDKNNVDLVKESLSGPDNETGKWYDRDGKEYDVSEILNEDKTYYADKPYMIKYNVDVSDQAKLPGEDLTLYDEVIKDSDTAEIITKFDTVGGNDIDDVTSLKITTYTLKDFNDSDGNIYLPGSKYTKDEDLELDVNYNSEDHYNEIELPIPVKHGYKFEYWTLDGERIDEYTPKTNETLVAVWTEIKYHFVDDEVEYEKENTDNVIFETVEGLDNFEELYINGKQLEKDSDYILDGNKIILTEKGKAYLDSLEPGEYEVHAEFSDSNSDVYGIIKVSEKEVVPEDEPDNPSDEPKDNPITPKTSDYILFTIIIAITALISSIFVYKKIEY